MANVGEMHLYLVSSAKSSGGYASEEIDQARGRSRRHGKWHQGAAPCLLTAWTLEEEGCTSVLSTVWVLLSGLEVSRVRVGEIPSTLSWARG